MDFLPEDLYSIELLVIPKWGLYANMTAQLISQLSSHFIIHYHRRIVRQATGEDVAPSVPIVTHTTTTLMDDEENEIGENDFQAPVAKSLKGGSNVDVTGSDAAGEATKDRLCDHTFRRPHRGEADKLVVRRFVSPILCVTAATLCVLVVLGCFLPTYSIDALGMVGVFVETGQGFSAADTEYSVISTMQMFFDQAKLTGTAKDYIGLGSLTILVVLTVLVVPVVQAGVLLLQWFDPLTKKRRYRLSIVLEILQAWQYAEVYLLALLVGSWQLGPLSEFMINPYCESLRGIFAELVYYGLLKDEDAQCYRADVNVEPTFYVLLVGALLLALVNMFVMKAASHYFRDEDGKAKLIETATLSDLGALEAHEDDTVSGALIDDNAIHPVPVLFSDRFRWFLCREDSMVPSELSNQSHRLSRQSSANVRTMGTVGKGSMSKLSRPEEEKDDDYETRQMESSSDDDFATGIQDETEANARMIPKLLELNDFPNTNEAIFESDDDEDEQKNNYMSYNQARRNEFQDDGSDDNGHAQNWRPFESDGSDINTVSELSLSGFNAESTKNRDTCDI